MAPAIGPQRRQDTRGASGLTTGAERQFVASRPLWQAFLARMDATNGMDIIVEELSAGKMLARVMRERGWSSTMVYRYMHMTEERWARYLEAKKQSAGAMAAEAMDIADASNSVMLPHQVTAAKLRVDTRRWAAGLLNREEYGEKAQAQVSVQIGSVGELHLGALLAHGGPEAQKVLPPAPTQPLPTEVVEDGGEDEAHDPSAEEHAALTGGETPGEQGAEHAQGA